MGVEVTWVHEQAPDRGGAVRGEVQAGEQDVAGPTYPYSRTPNPLLNCCSGYTVSNS